MESLSKGKSVLEWGRRLGPEALLVFLPQGRSSKREFAEFRVSPQRAKCWKIFRN